MAKKKTPAKKAKPEKNKKVASARQAGVKKVLAKAAKPAKKVVTAKAGKIAAQKPTPVVAQKPILGKKLSVKPGKTATVKVPVAPKAVVLPPVAPKVAKGKAPIEKPAALAKSPVDKKAKAVGGKKTGKGGEAIPAEMAAAESEVILTNADGKRYCKVGECDELATSDSYCRYHYLLNWKRIQLRKKILAGDKLNRYIEELTARYPDKYLEMIRKDLATDKDFLAALQELEIDEGADDYEQEDDSKNYIDEVRGVGPSTGGGQEEDDY